MSYGRFTGNYGEIKIDIPGSARAYHDITILPIRAKHLTIPMHSSAYGKKTSDFTGLFRPKGKNALAMVDDSGNLVWMFALAKKAFQRKDSTLMPTDQTLGDNIVKSLVPNIDKAIANHINNL